MLYGLSLLSFRKNKFVLQPSTDFAPTVSAVLLYTRFNHKGRMRKQEKTDEINRAGRLL